jgi:hypothetical protein
MISVKLYPVDSYGGILTIVKGFLLPESEKIQNFIPNALLQHPLNLDIVTDNSSIEIILRVTITGTDYYSMPPWVTIDYISFLSNKESPICLNFHLVRYMGDMNDYPWDCPDANVVIKKEIDWINFNSILLHEFAHLLDAMNTSFKFDERIQTSLAQDHRQNSEILWNSYINFRLRRILADNFSMPLTYVESRFRLNAAYTYLDLVKMAKEEQG